MAAKREEEELTLPRGTHHSNLKRGMVHRDLNRGESVLRWTTHSTGFKSDKPKRKDMESDE